MIDTNDAALIIIDMQNGFIDPDSSLGIAGAAATVPACARALDQVREAGIPVFFVRRIYADDGSDVEAPRYATWIAGGKPISHASAKPGSVDFPADLAPKPGDRVIDKPRFSAFFGTELDLILRRMGKGTVVLIGTTTPNCVRATCYDALSLDYNVVIVEDCCSSRTPEVQQANMEDMAAVGAQLIDLETFCTSGLSAVEDIVAQARAAIAQASRR